MTELLEQGIEAVRGLPADRQDLAGHLLLTLAAGEPRLTLTAEQIDDVQLEKRPRQAWAHLRYRTSMTT